MSNLGVYSRLTMTLSFMRNLGYYIIQIYIPSSMIVILSWVSFWIDRTAAPARVTLGITTVLTMVTFIWSTNASLPKISYVKGIDVYLVCCFFMTFAVVIEYGAVSFIHRRHERFKRMLAGVNAFKSNRASGLASSTVVNMEDKVSNGVQVHKAQTRNSTHPVERGNSVSDSCCFFGSSVKNLNSYSNKKQPDLNDSYSPLLWRRNFNENTVDASKFVNINGTNGDLKHHDHSNGFKYNSNENQHHHQIRNHNSPQPNHEHPNNNKVMLNEFNLHLNSMILKE